MQIRNNLDLVFNQILNGRFQLLAGDPSTPVEGQFYWNSTSHKFRLYDGTAFSDVAVGTPITSHHALIDLTNFDDHTQYVHIANARTITGVHTFNPASAGAAFILGANATGQLIAGLNADKLDGLDSTAFAATVHTHTSSQITDLSTVVHAYTLDSFAAPAADVSLNSHKVTNLATPTSNTDAANKQYVDAARQGLDAKDAVRVAAFTNVVLASAPSTLNSLSLAVGDRILLGGQTTASENGIYSVTTVGTGSNGVWARTPDAVTGELTSGAFVLVQQGTYAGTSWFVSTADPITVGTTSITWSQYSLPSDAQGTNLGGGTGIYSGRVGNALQFFSLGVGSNKLSIATTTNVVTFDVNEGNINRANLTGTTPVTGGGTGGTSAATARTGIGAVGKFSQTIGDGSTLTFTINHNLNSQDVVVAVRKAASTFDAVIVDWKPTDVNNVVVTFAGTAPATNEFRVTVLG